MYSIRYLSSFNDWLRNIKHRPTKIRLLRRLDRVKHGNLGDVKPVAKGVFEMREFFGPGWRMYYVWSSSTALVMLKGGDKSTQKQDVTSAIALANSVRGVIQ